MTGDDYYALQQQLVAHEGLRVKPYTDTAGKLTVGVGRNLTDVGISTVEAYQLLEHDVASVMARLSASLPWFLRLDAVRQRVLIDMAFNLGGSGLLTFTAMLAAVQRGDYEAAADEMLASHWATEVGTRATTLAAWMRSGVTT